MQPESSDGFASVGTVLPSEEVALLPGGLFLFPAYSALLAPTMDNAERYIAKWQGAGLLDEQSASAIRAYETAHARPSGQQWQVLVALILGSILLGAGVLLFVAAH